MLNAFGSDALINIVTLGDSRFGTTQFVMPDGRVDVKRSWITTPLGNIPVFRARTWVPDRVDVSFAKVTV